MLGRKRLSYKCLFIFSPSTLAHVADRGGVELSFNRLVVLPSLSIYIYVQVRLEVGLSFYRFVVLPSLFTPAKSVSMFFAITFLLCPGRNPAYLFSQPTWDIFESLSRPSFTFHLSKFYMNVDFGGIRLYLIIFQSENNFLRFVPSFILLVHPCGSSSILPSLLNYSQLASLHFHCLTVMDISYSYFYLSSRWEAFIAQLTDVWQSFTFTVTSQDLSMFLFLSHTHSIVIYYTLLVCSLLLLLLFQPFRRFTLSYSLSIFQQCELVVLHSIDNNHNNGNSFIFKLQRS